MNITSDADAERWADSRAVRYLSTHRVTVAPGPVEIEPWQLDNITRQVADERAASQRYHDSQANSAEGCADTSDDAEWSKPPMTPTEALTLVVALALSAVLSIGVMAIVWGAI